MVIPTCPSVPLLDPEQRRVTPELLDLLPIEHPVAQKARRGLHLTNRLLGNFRWLERVLTQLARPSELVLELGAGTGELGARLAERGLPIDAIDLCPRPDCWPKDRLWHAADLRSFEAFERYPVIFGNLLFHHLTNDELHALGKKLQSARVIIACDLSRRRLSQLFFGTVAPLFGANHVTIYDGLVSIAAGFEGDELPNALGLRAPEWSWRCEASMFGRYRMIATRNLASEAGSIRTS